MIIPEGTTVVVAREKGDENPYVMHCLKKGSFVKLDSCVDTERDQCSSNIEVLAFGGSFSSSDSRASFKENVYVQFIHYSDFVLLADYLPSKKTQKNSLPDV